MDPSSDPSSVVLTSGPPVDPIPGSVSLEPLADDDTWVARTALAITEACQQRIATPPLLLVFTGPHARHAPHIGFAQRAARRAVRGYVLIDPEFPAPGAVTDWPDAPVTVVLDDPQDPRARDATLRGWEVLVGDPDRIIGEVSQRP